ncbi:glycosyltransferase [Shewanella algae]|uniref:glycosyltransferase n=1 Tax=Shewanella algae TaxID=38313 RepID=UPI001AAD2D5D|nr:glycosyltransferase [Shewanella algae]QTE92136.1 glycosyltransferase [Shewanella algae]
MSCEVGSEIKVSICVITYNHESYIEECLNSLVSQKTEFPFEIVIRDDNSTDETCRILKQYADDYPQLITLLDSEVNLGMNKNLRAVINATKGEYVAFCEGDDFWCDDKKIQYQYEVANENREIDFFVHGCHLVNGVSERLRQSKGRFFGGNERVKFGCMNILSYAGQFAPTSSYFINNSVLRSLPTWLDDAPIADFFLELYAARHNGGVYLPKIMSCYRVESIGSWSDKMKNTSPQDKIEYADRMIFAIEKMQADFPNYKSNFNRKINAFNFIASLSYLKLGNVASFKKRIIPLDNLYISKYHKLMVLLKDIPLGPSIACKIYELLKKIQLHFDKI